MNSEAVVTCINESCKSWHDNNLSLLAAALLLRHFYVPNSDGGQDTPMDTNENNTTPVQVSQDNSSALTVLPPTTTTSTVTTTTSTTTTTPATTIVHDGAVNGGLNGGLNGVPTTTEVIRTIPAANNTPTINNLITPNSSINLTPTNGSPTDKPNKNSTINALIHATTSSTNVDDLPKTPTTPSNTSNKLSNFPSTPTGPPTPTLSISAPPTPCTPCTPIIDTLTNTTTDTIHHHTELITVSQDSAPPTPTPEYIPVNAAVPTRHVKECGHNIICILQKNNFSLSTSKKVSAASQQVYVNHVYPPIDATKSVLEMIAIVKEFWKIQMAPSPLSFCGLVTYMKNLTTPPQDNVVSIYNPVSIYPPLTMCPQSPAIAPPRRKRAKIEAGPNGQQTPTSHIQSDPTLLASHLITCTEQNKSLQTRLVSLETDIKSLHQICLQQECELKNMGHACMITKASIQAENDLKVVPWPYGEKVVPVNQSLWQACFLPHTPMSYWFREEQHIMDVINEKEGDVICGYHVAHDILLMKVDLEWLKKSFDHPSRKPEETMQHLELAYTRFDGYCADSGEVGLFPSRGFAKIVRKMALHRKLPF